MAVRVISGEQVRRLVPMSDCVERMRAALMALAGGDAVQPLRSATWLPDRRGLLGVMPGYLGEPAALGVKVVTVFPDNHARGLDSHQGAVLLFDVEDGSLTAVLDGGAVTAVRTAAVSAVATDLLARPDAGDLAILGSGAQARTHLEALAVGAQRRKPVGSAGAFGDFGSFGGFLRFRHIWKLIEGYGEHNERVLCCIT